VAWAFFVVASKYRNGVIPPEVRRPEAVGVVLGAQRLLGDLVGVGGAQREVRGEDPARGVDAGVELGRGGGLGSSGSW
jgi:hypothetical protein